MPTNKYFACPFCRDRFTREDMIIHISRKHEDELPEGFTPLRATFHAVNRKDFNYKRPCRICKKATSWDENKGRYNFLCDNPKCKELWVENMKNTMGDKYGAFRPTSSVEGLEKMLAGRKISGTYKFTSGGSVPYTGSYEKNCLEFMDKVLDVKIEDLEVPGPAIKYPYKGQEHIYIPDVYYRPYNLMIEIKDGGSNPNKHPGYSEVRAKKIAKENYVIKHTDYNYLRLTNNDFSQLLGVFAELKLKFNNDDKSRTIHVHESSLIEHMGLAATSPMVGFIPGNDVVIVNNAQKHTFGVADSPRFEKVIALDAKKHLGLQDKNDFGEDDQIKTYIKKDKYKDISKAIEKYMDKDEELSESAFYELIFGHPMYTSDQLLFEDLIDYDKTVQSINDFVIESTLSSIFGDDEENDIYISEGFEEFKSTFLNEEDVKYNYDAFSTGNSDILFISGPESFGRAADFTNIAQQFGADIIHLDDVQQHYRYSDKKLRQKHILIYKYFCDTDEGIEERKKKKKDPEVNLYETVPHFLSFFLANKEPNKRYIVEGHQIIDLLAANRLDINVLKKYSVLLKGSSYLQTQIQNMKSNPNNDTEDKAFSLLKDYIDNISKMVKNVTHNNFSKSLKKKEEIANKDLSEIVDDALGESTVVEEVYRSDITSKYLEKGDTCYNLNRWSIYDNNILFVTGISGSGKSTLGTDLAKEFSCGRVELDYIAVYYLKKTQERNRYDHFLNLVKADCPEAVEFLYLNPVEKYGIREKWADTGDILYDFCNWFTTKFQGNGKLYIINGAYLCDLYSFSYFYDKPLILKDINYIKTVFRRTWREFEDSKDPFLKKVESGYKALKTGLSKSYKDANAKFKDYKRDLDLNANLVEACKDLSTARKLASEVKDLASKYDANFYFVTDGASATNNDGTNEAVKHARDTMKKWESDHGFDAKEDWVKDNKSIIESANNKISEPSIKSPEELFDWMKKNLHYTNFSKLKTWQKVLDSKLGSCHDFVMFEKHFFDKFSRTLGVRYNTLFCIELKEGEEVGGRTHSFLYWYDTEDKFGKPLPESIPKKYYWFEVAWNSQAGMRGPYSSIEELKKDVEEKMLKESKYDHVEFGAFKGTPGMGLQELVEASLDGPLDESQDASKLDKDHITKTGYTFKYIDLDSSEAEKYVDIKEWRNRAKRAELAICKETNELAGYIYVKKENGIMGPLKVYKKYRGYGVSNKLIEDGIDKFGGKELGVFKDNEIAMKLYNSHGFKVKEDHDKYVKMIKESVEDIMIESNFLEPTDSRFNLDTWDINENNILFITGVSGAGKTTLAKDLNNLYECEVISLDNISSYYMTKSNTGNKRQEVYNTVAEECFDASIFLDENSTDSIGIKKLFKETMEVQKKFCEWFLENYSNNGKLYVIESNYIPFLFDLDWYTDKPIIVKEMDYRDTVVRRLQRMYRGNNKLITEQLIETNMKNPAYKKNFEEFTQFSKDLQSRINYLNCSYINEPFYCTEDDTFDLTGDIPLQEVSEEDLKKNIGLSPVFVMLSFNGSIVGKVIKGYGKDLGWEYSHSSLSFTSSLSSLYSFNISKSTDDEGRVHKYNGFIVEHFRDYKNNPKSKIKVIAILVDTETKAKIKKAVQYYLDNINKTKYAKASLFKALTGTGGKVQNFGNMTLFCSQFVDAVLKQANIDIAGKGSSINVHPSELGQFKDKNNYFTVYEGMAKDYDEVKVDNKINYMKATMNYDDLAAITNKTGTVDPNDHRVENRAKDFVNRKIAKYKESKKKEKPEPLDGPLAVEGGT